MHNENRRRRLLRRTHSKGFTLLELGVAVLVFSLVAGIVTLAVARTQLSGAHSRLRVSVESEVRRLVAVASTGDFDELVDGTFTRPEACTASTHQSCISVLDRNFTVDWDVLAVADRAGISSTHAAGVRVAASTALPDGTGVTIEKYVTAPGGGREGTALLRVRLVGETYAGPVYLLDDSGSIVGSSVAASGLALIRADETACDDTTCQLALRPDGGTETDDLAISYASLIGPARGLLLSEAAVAETSITLEQITPVHVLLYAENPDGRGAWNDEPGSVCLHLVVDHAGTTVDVPGCNTEQADRVTWRTFAPDPAEPLRTAPVPSLTPLTVSTDPSAGYCAADGQKGWNGATLTWETAPVCTSWTWGPFDELRPGMTAKTEAGATTFTLTAGTDTYLTAVWVPDTSTAPSRPAGGSSGDPLWERPRDIPACATTGTCEPETGTPETACPGGHCNSTGNRAPVLSAPVVGTYGIASVTAAAGTSTTFTLTFADNDLDGSIAVTALNPPAGLTFGGNPVGDGTSLVSGGGSNATAELTITTDPAFTGTTLTLSIGDGAHTRTETVAITDGTEDAHLLRTGPVRVSQDGTTSGRLLAIDTAGEPLTSVTVTDTLPAEVTLSSPTATAGWFALSYTAGDAAAGSATFTLTSGAATTGSVPITVVSTATGLSVDAVTVSQGTAGTVTATALDAAGDPAEGRHLWFTLVDAADDTWPLGSILSPRGCLTGVSGECSVAITTETSAVTGTYAIDVSGDSAEGSGVLTVTASLSRIESTGGSAEQGGSTTLSLRAYDGRNEPAVGVTISLVSAVTGIGVPETVTTDAQGRAAVTVTTTTSTPAGSADISLTAGAFSRTVRIEVTQTVGSATTSATPATVAQSGMRVVTVTARDPQGAPAPYVRLDITADEGLLVPGSVLTGAAGTADIYVSAGPAVLIGTYDIRVAYDGTQLAALTLTVVPGVARVDVLGDLVADDTARVSLRLRGSDGTPLTGRAVSLDPVDERTSVSAVDSVTDANGWARFDITSGSVPSGSYEFILHVDGREITVGVTAP